MGIFGRSLKELKSVRTLTICSMMLALSVVLNAYVRVPLSDQLRISIGYLASAAVGFMFGPVPAMMVSGLSDILVFLISPMGGAYFPGFTLTAMLGGMTYGLFFYDRRISVVSVLAAQAVVTLLLHLVLNSYFLVLLYGSQFFTVARFVKNAIQYPFDIVCLLSTLALVGRIVRQIGIKRGVQET